MDTKAFYWIGFLLYSVSVVYLGWRGYRNRSATQDIDLAFWAAGKSLNATSVGLSISASFMSISWSCVYTVQLFYWYGLSALWLVPIPWLLTMAGFYLLAPHFRRLPAFSQPEMLAHRFGKPMRQIFALPVALVFTVWGGAEIFAAAKVLTPLLDVPFWLTLMLIAGVVAAYSFLGGFSAVVVTDKLQFALVAFFIITIAALGLNGLHTQFSAGNWFEKLPPPPKSQGEAVEWIALAPGLIIMTLIAYLPGWLVETDIWLRIQAAKDLKAARRGILLASAASFIFLALLPMIIGLAALILYPPHDTYIPAELEDGAAIFAVLMRDFSPPLLSLLLSIGLAAAAMSTIDTCGNVVALSLSYDMIEPRIRRAGIDRGKIARIMSAAAIVLTFFYALFIESLWDIFYLSSGILTTTLFLPMMALFIPEASAVRVKRSAAAGFFSTLIFYILESRGWLFALQPAWISETGLGYILWGFIAAGAGFLMPLKRR